MVQRSWTQLPGLKHAVFLAITYVVVKYMVRPRTEVETLPAHSSALAAFNGAYKASIYMCSCWILVHDVTHSST